ncbi:hypothetical protein HGB07_04030 [Candidatus Roizmanbacteria bacterium]|nr:hypothetical protein [Candidatus Roizmanbacteria bacterium]
MNWLIYPLTWYLYLFVVGLIFFPYVRRLFPNFLDKGYIFSKTIGIIVLTYLALLGGILHIIPFSQISLILILIASAAGAYTIIQRENQPLLNDTGRLEKATFISLIIFEELLFLAALIALTYVRGQEPSIHGLEKFMDFGFINSILRSHFFPPLDMWLSADPQAPNGYPINYYYFGHLSGALLIKLTNTPPAIGYNLILATIFAQGIALSFGIVSTIIANTKEKILSIAHQGTVLIFGLLGALIMNLGGNLHTIYLFTKGYPPEKTPLPFWQIWSTFSPEKYWYPNATRFIPYTIHEFPSYSYVVADLHGHVFDIPFVLITIALLYSLFQKLIHPVTYKTKLMTSFPSFLHPVVKWARYFIFIPRNQIIITAIIGAMCSIHYMTNAFDGLIYLLFTLIILFLFYQFSYLFLIHTLTLIVSFGLVSLPFSLFFAPFASGIGVNCSPKFLIDIGKIGPFLFEKSNCQLSAYWMLGVLWGFFWLMGLFLLGIVLYEIKTYKLKKLPEIYKTDIFMLVLFFFGTLLIIIPEFFYIKDIYPIHFRANTMFKLGYQAFIIMSLASAYVFYRLSLLPYIARILTKTVGITTLVFVLIYSFYAFPAYYGKGGRPVQLDGSVWLNDQYPEDKEIITYLNTHITGSPVVLEAQGDSYTDYERISAYTGLPTVAGWWVHEWLWRGSSDVVGKRVADITNLYESTDINQTRSLIEKYHIKYVVVSQMERAKYQNLNSTKFSLIGKLIFTSTNGFGALYQVD